jgi:hypothetical protein
MFFFLTAYYEIDIRMRSRYYENEKVMRKG